MRNEQLIEVITAIDNINADLYNQCKYTDKRGKEDIDPWIWMELQYGVGGVMVVEFLGEYLWNSENEERTWIEKSGSVGTDDLVYAHYESIEPFLRRRANELIVKLQKIKL